MTAKERRHFLRPLRGGNVIYTGKVWAGTMVNDTFMRETTEDILLAQRALDQYHGMFTGWVEREIGDEEL